MPLFTVDDGRKLWQEIYNDRDCSEWVPEFLHCGPFDYKLQAFPIIANGSHYIWIPVEWKFALRLLNHVTYCLWHTSLDSRLPDTIRNTSWRAGKYGELLRFGFFDEVLEYWYRPDTQLPTNERPTRQRQPLHSYYLTSFLVHLYNTGSFIPTLNAGQDPKWKSDPAMFDWERWAMKNTIYRAVYGALPNVGTEEHKLLSEENKAARIPLNAPSVEIDSFSWTQYSSEVLAIFSNKQLRHSAIPAVPSQGSRTTETDANESPTLSEPEVKRRRIQVCD